MKKDGFVSMTLVCTFLVLFLFLMLAVLNAYAQQNRYSDAIDKHINITIDTPNKSEYCPYSPNEKFYYDFTGEAQEYIAGCSGKYKIELWGANGYGEKGGKRAYTSGNIILKQNKKIYVYIGEAGKYDAGGNAISFNNNISGVNYSGGGSTDIRLVDSGDWNEVNSLTSRIMVASGGGSSSNTTTASNGGGIHGDNVGSTVKGGASLYSETSYSTTFGVATGTPATGGGGYFAGAGGTVGAGGSSYISGHPGFIAVIREGSTKPREIYSGLNDSGTTVLCAAGTIEPDCSTHYSGYYFSGTAIKTGTNVPAITDENGNASTYSNYNHGFAVITFLSQK